MPRLVVRPGLRPVGALMVGAAVASNRADARHARAQEQQMNQAQMAQLSAQTEAAQAEAAAAKSEAQRATAAAQQPQQQPAQLYYPEPQPQQSQPYVQYVPYASPPNAIQQVSVPPPIVSVVMLEVVTPHIVNDMDPVMVQNQIISVPAGAIVSLRRGTLQDGLGAPYQDYIEVDYNGKIGKISKFVVKRMDQKQTVPAIPAAIISQTQA